jgi:L-tryptophan--pyruvate aminotransferase
MGAGGGERLGVPGGAAGLALCATLLCNVVSLAYFLHGYLVDGRRRGACAARSGADDDDVMLADEEAEAARSGADDDGALLADAEAEATERDVALPPDAVLNLQLYVRARSHSSSLAAPRRAALAR